MMLTPIHIDTSWQLKLKEKKIQPRASGSYRNVCISPRDFNALTHHTLFSLRATAVIFGSLQLRYSGRGEVNSRSFLNTLRTINSPPQL